MPHVKRYFQRHPWNTSFFRAQIMQILLFSGMLVLERSKITVWEQHFFEHRIFLFSMEVLHMCLTYLKRFFHKHQWSGFFLSTQMCQILLFSRMPVLEGPNIIICVQHFFKKKITMDLLGICLPYVKRYFQEHQLGALFFRAQITQDYVVFKNSGFWEIKSKITVWERHKFSEFFCYEIFTYVAYVLTLRQKVFSGAPVRWLFL